ncbi:MAG: FAD-binding oxidoreductase [Cyanobacteria bacterium P01_A01_bin.84]
MSSDKTSDTHTESLLQAVEENDAIVNWEDIETKTKGQILEALNTTNSDTNHPDYLVYPRTEEQLAKIIAIAKNTKWRILTCGGASKLNWGGLTKQINLVISTERLNQRIEHAIGDFTVTVDAGVNFAHLQKTLAKQNQFLALNPTFPDRATLGGIIATSDTGSLRQRYGSVRDQLLGITFVRHDGEIVKAGGKVVKNVAGYDLMKLFTGSYGTLGVITQLTFRLYPIQEASGTVVITGAKDKISEAAGILRGSGLTPTDADLVASQLIEYLLSNLKLDPASGRKDTDLGLIVRFQSIKESVQEQSKQILEIAQKLNLYSVMFFDTDEEELWQLLHLQMHNINTKFPISCKIGVLPSNASEIMSNVEVGYIHNASGLGILRVENEKDVMRMRNICQSCAGFLSVLEAPKSVKDNLDIWGYKGNALNLMQQIKSKFDPENMFNPGRFVGEI